MSRLFSFRYNSSSLRFGPMPWQFQNIMFVLIKKTSDTCHERWPAGEVLFRRFRLFVDCLVIKGRGLRELRMAEGLVKAENQKGSGMSTGILEAGWHWGANTTNRVKQGTSRDNDS